MPKIVVEYKTDRELLIALTENSNNILERMTALEKHAKDQNGSVAKNCRHIRDLRLVLITIVVVAGTFLGFQVPIILGG